MKIIKIIDQEKSDWELNKIASDIIDIIESNGLNLAEKYKVISCLFESLKEFIEEQGGAIGEIIKK